MKIKIVSFSCGLILLTAAIALAQSADDDFNLTKSTIDNGGGSSSGSEFSVTGTIGQADANPRASSGGGFMLAGGFWAQAHDVMFKSGFEGG